MKKINRPAALVFHILRLMIIERVLCQNEQCRLLIDWLSSV